MATPNLQIVRCKVCGEQMSHYDHCLLGCDCQGWGDVDSGDDDLGIFDAERHELVEVVPTSDLTAILTQMRLARERGQALAQALAELRGALGKSIEQMAGPLGRARSRALDGVSGVEQIRDLDLVADGTKELRSLFSSLDREVEGDA